MFFSVIIPIYNVEDYLEQCVNSVLNQTYKDLEIILVNDGSKDKCPEMCDDFAKKDERILVLHKKNGGLSSARNFGMDHASGKYILFLDSDDYWSEKEALNKLHEELLKVKCLSDALIYHNILEYPGGKQVIDRKGRKVSGDFNELSVEDKIIEMVKRDVIPGGACTLALKREFLVNNNLYFKEGIKSEDIEWMFRVLNCKPDFRFTDLRFYVYRKNREGSISSAPDYNHLLQYVEILNECRKIQFCNEKIERATLAYAAYHLTILMGLSGLLGGQNTKMIRKKLRELKELFYYDIHPKAKKVKKIVRMIGFNNTSRILSGYLKYRAVWRK